MLQEGIRNTGTVVMGCRSYNMGDPDSFADSYEYHVPIFILTHRPRARHPKENDHLTITFVPDGIHRAIALAQTAAGTKNNMLIGASILQQCLNAGLIDELQIGNMPVLLGDGLRLFE